MARDRALATLRGLRYHEMTREERAKLMIKDYDAYAEKVPEGFWLMLLDGVAKAGPITDNVGE